MKPEVIYLETTNLCNAKCIMCPHEKITRNPKVMTDEIFYKAVKDCKKLGIKGNSTATASAKLLALESGEIEPTRSLLEIMVKKYQ